MQSSRETFDLCIPQPGSRRLRKRKLSSSNEYNQLFRPLLPSTVGGLRDQSCNLRGWQYRVPLPELPALGEEKAKKER